MADPNVWLGHFEIGALLISGRRQHPLSPNARRWLVATWAKEVNEAIHRTAGGRMISEWAKNPVCSDVVFRATYSPPAKGIPEVQ
jgi:hypothetical protein